MKEALRKWWPLVAFLLFFVAVLLFILFGGKEDTTEAHYVQGVNEITLDGVSYTLVNDIEAETYIGSMVSDIIKGCRGERIGSVQSYGIMVVAILFEVPGDTEHRYLTDSNDRLYVQTAHLEEYYKMLASPDAFCDYRMVGADKNMDSLKKLDEAAVEVILEAQEKGQEVTVEDKAFIINYDNRREVFAFTSDGFLYRARLELFLYNNEVYVTTHFEGDEDTSRAQVLKGVRLPEELQSMLKEIWN